MTSKIADSPYTASTSAARSSDRVRERNRCPRRSVGRNPLIVAVREAAFEIGLERRGPGLYVPGAIFLLRAQEVLDTLAIHQICRGHAGLVQRVQGLAGG